MIHADRRTDGQVKEQTVRQATYEGHEQAIRRFFATMQTRLKQSVWNKECDTNVSIFLFFCCSSFFSRT